MSIFFKLRTGIILCLLWSLCIYCLWIDGTPSQVGIHKDALVAIPLTTDLRIQIPEAYEVTQSRKGLQVNLNPNGRALKQFEIDQQPAANIDRLKYTKLQTLKNGGVLYYYTYSEAGGSGGPEYQLAGILRYKEQQFQILAIEQKEYGKGNPEFCFALLATLNNAN